MIIVWIGLVLLVVVVFAVTLRLGASGVNRAAAEAKVTQGATVIDVRTPAEYATGHFKGSRNIPLQELRKRLAEAGAKQDAIVVCCASGVRSTKAVRMLTAAGFTDVTNAGGLKNLAR